MQTRTTHIHPEREDVRRALAAFERELNRELEETPRGSGHAVNKFDQLKASITEVRTARRILWMD